MSGRFGQHCVREMNENKISTFSLKYPHPYPIKTLVLFSKSKDLFKISKITFQNHMHFSELSFFLFRSKTVKEDIKALWLKV